MKLNNVDINYINQRMETYPIPYQEIYDELLDHVISAVETTRNNNDERDIELVFNDIMDTHFGNAKEIRRIVLQNVMAYHKKIGKEFRVNFKHYLNWQTVAVVIILIVTSFYLPQNNTLNTILLFATIITSFWPTMYIVFMVKNTKTDKKKRSLVKNYMLSISQYLTGLTFVTLFVFRFAKPWHLSLLNPLRYSPFIYITLLCFFTIYSLSTIRLCKQVLKTDN